MWRIRDAAVRQKRYARSARLARPGDGQDDAFTSAAPIGRQYSGMSPAVEVGCGIACARLSTLPQALMRSLRSKFARHGKSIV